MFDRFAKEKSDFLNKKDKSRKGCVDEGIKGVVAAINSKKDCYTTSSCAGRIVLLEARSKKKNECSWIFSKHEKAGFSEAKGALKKRNKHHPIWLKQQPLILHVACRNLDAAKKLLGTSRKIFKHSGILSITERKIIVEIIGNEKIEAIAADRNFVIDEKYLRNLVKYANANFAENKRKTMRFLKILNKELK